MEQVRNKVPRYFYTATHKSWASRALQVAIFTFINAEVISVPRGPLTKFK